MFILITSCENNEEFRDVLRKTWLNDTSLPYLFVVGGADKTYVKGDILYVEAIDDYYHVPHKQLAAIQFCFKNYKFDYLFICDDDAYVCMDRLIDCDYHLYDYYGSGPVRMWDIPYYVTGGPGIFLSLRSVTAIVNMGGKHLDTPIYTSVSVCNGSEVEKCFWGDRFIGLTLNEAGIEPFYDDRFVELSFNPLSDLPKQYNNIISYHVVTQSESLTPKKILEIHQHFQQPLKPIRVAMVVDQWSMGGAEKEFTDMILDANPDKIQYVGIALQSAWEFRVSPVYKHLLPKFHCGPKNYEYIIDDDVIKHNSFEQAIDATTYEADVIIKWHVYNEFLENINKPSILISNATSWYTEHTHQKVKADKYVSNSIWASKWFPSHANNVETIYSGHEEKTIEPQQGREKIRKDLGFKPTDKVISHIGRINLDKNLPTLIESIKLLDEDWKLLLVGHVATVQEDKFYEFIEEHIPGRYSMICWVDHVGDAYAATDVFVLSSFYEGFSNALAEAWMSKTPTVFSRCGSADELIEKYGNIGTDVPTNITVSQLAKAIEKAPENTEGIENAYKMIKHFDKKKSARNWERCITEVCYNREKLKVGILMPNLSFGGQETWVKNLGKCTSRGMIEYTFFKPRGCDVESEIDTVISLSKYMDIHIEDTDPKFSENLKALNLNNVTLHDTSNKLMGEVGQSDVIITWGVENLPELVKYLSIPIILLSKCADQWNKDLLDKISHVATDFVTKSLASNIFPQHLKNVASIINNPVSPDRQIITKNRKRIRAEWGAKKDDVLIGFIGRWDYQKNPLALARGISRLPDNYKAVFVGTDWRFTDLADIENYDRWAENKTELSYREELEKILHPEKYILVPPQINVANCYNALDGVIVPSRNEGFGISIIEAWIMGKPLVCCNVGIYKEFSKGGITINHNDKDEIIAKAIRHSLKTTDENLQIIKFRAFRKFNMNIFVNRWCRFIKMVVEKHNRKTIEIEVDYFAVITTLFKKYKTAKRVARKLNIMKFSLPEGEKEWTYTLVNKFL